MKKCLWPFLVFLSCALMACNDDDEPTPISSPDTKEPNIEISSPEINSNLKVFELLLIHADFTDNARLKEVRVFIVDPDGTRNEIEGLDHLKSINNTMTFLHLTMRLPVGSAIGNYKVVFEAEDMQENVAKDSVSFNLHAPDLDISEFTAAFVYNGFIAAMADWEERFLREPSFNSGLFHRVDQDEDERLSKAEWERFILDFNIKRQNWSGWDVDKDDNLTIEEFSNGLQETKLFAEWNKDKNEVLSEEELAIGVFSRWDNNADEKLSRAEYEVRLSTYFYF